MTERTVRSVAKELAGEFYDQSRSERFRRENPNQNVFVAKMWPSFVDLARQSMSKLLASPGVHEHVKQATYEALLEDNRRQLASPGIYVPQATLEPREKEDRKLIDVNPHFVTSKG